MSLLIARSYFVNYSFSFIEFMLKLLSNYYDCQAILLDQQTISTISCRGFGSIQGNRLCSAAEDWHYSWLYALWSSRFCHIAQWTSDSHWWYVLCLIMCYCCKHLGLPFHSPSQTLPLTNDNSCNSFGCHHFLHPLCSWHHFLHIWQPSAHLHLCCPFYHPQHLYLPLILLYF